MWEILTQSMPWAHKSASFRELNDLIDCLNAGERPPIPAGSNREYMRLMERCWTGSASDRPTFDEVSASSLFLSVV
jgi:hypothetical protein